MWIGKLHIPDFIIFMVAFVMIFMGLNKGNQANYLEPAVMTKTEYNNISQMGSFSGESDKILTTAIDNSTTDNKEPLLDYIEYVNETIYSIYELEIPEEFNDYRDNLIKELETGADIAYHLYNNQFDEAKALIEVKNETYQNGIVLFKQGLNNIGCHWFQDENGIRFTMYAAG